MIETIDIVARPAGHTVAPAQALSEGLQAHGVLSRIVSTPAAVRSPVCAVWGWRAGSLLHAAGRHVIVMERGYIGDRFVWYSLGVDGLNGLAQWPPLPADGSRLSQYHPDALQPWRPAGGAYVLICGQVPGDAGLYGRDLYAGWYGDARDAARARYSRPVVFRPHPLAAAKGGSATLAGTVSDCGPLAPALRDAALVVTYSSNTAVDAMLAGVPTVCAHPGSMAAGIALRELPASLDVPEPAGRRAWAESLAWCQWSLPEMRSGVALAGVVGLLRG